MTLIKRLKNWWKKPQRLEEKVTTLMEQGIMKPTYEDYDAAVLHILNSQFRSSKVAVEIGSATEQTVLKELAIISKYKNWLKTQTDS